MDRENGPEDSAVALSCGNDGAFSPSDQARLGKMTASTFDHSPNAMHPATPSESQRPVPRASAWPQEARP
jgi:hypothetical protein